MSNPLTGYYNGHCCIVETCGKFGPFGFARTSNGKAAGPMVWGCNQHRAEAEEHSRTAQFPAPAAETPPWN